MNDIYYLIKTYGIDEIINMFLHIHFIDDTEYENNENFFKFDTYQVHPNYKNLFEKIKEFGDISVLKDDYYGYYYGYDYKVIWNLKMRMK